MSDTMRDEMPELGLVSLDLEQRAIGALLLDPSRVGDALRAMPEDLDVFVSPISRAAWRAMLARFDSGAAIDMALVAHDLSQDGELAGMSGRLTLGQYAARLTGCIETAGTPFLLPVYLEELAALAMRRRIIGMAQEFSTWALEDTDARGIVRAVQQSVLSLPLSAVSRESGNVKAIYEQLLADAESGRAVGTPIGIEAYDGWAGGLTPGHVMVVGAYTNVGKTWWAVATANAAIDAGLSVAFMSLEQPARDLYLRLLANRAGRMAYRLRHKGGAESYTMEEAEVMARATNALEGGNLAIFNRDCRSASQIRALTLAGGYDLVVVDYGQLIKAPKTGMKEYDANTENAHALQALAGESGATVLALSQISMDAQRRGADDDAIGFKSSGAWGEIVDLGLMLSRDPDMPDVVTVRAVKNRHGPTVHDGAEACYQVDRATGQLTLRSIDGVAEWR